MSDTLVYRASASTAPQVMRNLYRSSPTWNVKDGILKFRPLQFVNHNKVAVTNGASPSDIPMMKQAGQVKMVTDVENIQFPKALLLCFGLSCFTTATGMIIVVVSILSSHFNIGFSGLGVSVFGLLGVSITIEIAKRQRASI